MTLAISAPIRRRRPAVRAAAVATVAVPVGTTVVFPVRSEFDGDPVFSHLNLGPQEFMRVSVMSAAAFDAIPQDERPGQFERVGDAVLTIEPAARWEAPSLCSMPQPMPLSCTYDGEQIERTWRPGDTRFCRLCAICTARPSGGGRTSCVVLPDDATNERLIRIERRLDEDFIAGLRGMTDAERLKATGTTELPELPEEGEFPPSGLNDDEAFALLAFYSENPAAPPSATL